MKAKTKAVEKAAAQMSDLVTRFQDEPLGSMRDLVTRFQDEPLGSVMVLTGIIVSPEGHMVDKAVLVEVAGSNAPFEEQTRSTHYVSDTQTEGLRTVGMGARWPVGAQAETVAAGPLPEPDRPKMRKVSVKGARL